MRDMQPFADMVILAIKAALSPVLERLVSAEQVTKDLQERVSDGDARMRGVRDRLVTLETKVAMPPVVSPLPPAGPTATDIELLFVQRLEPLTKDCQLLRERLAAVEAREPVPGPPGPAGLPGMPGQDAKALDLDALEPLRTQLYGLRERLAVMESRPQLPGPPGEKGEPGLNGKDGLAGLSFEGVYQEGKSYDFGQMVTWGGSWWHCNEPTTTKPGDGSKAWTLAIKRGRDGKDGRDAQTLPVVSITPLRP